MPPTRIAEFADFYYAEGALDPKTMQLVALAAMAAAGCADCVPARFAAARQAGASDAEISEALYYAMRAGARSVWNTLLASPEIPQLNRTHQAAHQAQRLADRQPGTRVP